ncbi:hypothetical protein JEQ12_010001 [Ovis aries]|uniref:Zinc finger CCHC domain-containing protein 17 n=1 Tax=Ovis aries TaxID=9940 RepID=A0A836AN69_SHEEP|nr:hypothetical protein JEQ12_010001 [Ovis aries]
MIPQPLLAPPQKDRDEGPFIASLPYPKPSFGKRVAVITIKKTKNRLMALGLVHRTHMSSCRVDKPSEIVDVGDKVWVKLIGREMKNDRIKVSLSMKVVNQGTGKDLDPNNVIIEQEERRRRSFQDYTGQKITLEAVLNTTCKKCGCKGHFAKDCFMQPGGTKYSLIPDDEEEKEEAKSAEFEKPDTMRNSSRKRKKLRNQKIVLPLTFHLRLYPNTQLSS